MPETLRVVQVGDVASVAPAIAAALRAHADVIQVPLRQPGAGWLGPVKLLTVPARLAEALIVARRVRALEPDVVHAHSVPNGLAARLSGRPWVLHAHGSDVRGLSRLRRLAFDPIIRSADALVASTPDLVEIMPRHTVHVPTPVGVEVMPREPEWDVLVASAAQRVKGASISFGALRRLAAQRPDLRLAAQDGPAFEPGPWARLPRASKGEFLRRLAGARVVLGQFRLGALGVADLEAMAQGRPLVTWVRDDLYPNPPPVRSERDPERVAELVLELLDDREGARDLGAAASEWVRRVHDPDAVAAQLLDIYRRAMRSNR